MGTAASLTAVYLRQLLDVMPGLRDQVAPVLAQTGIDVRRLKEDAYYRIPFYKVVALLDHMADRFGWASVLQAVFQLRVKTFPVLGYAIVSSRCLEEAIANLIRFEPLVWNVGCIELRSDQQRAQLIWCPQYPVPPRAVEMAIAGWVSIGRQLFRESRRLIRVSFQHPAGQTDYDKYFGCPVVFGAQENGIEFPRGWLSDSLVDSDPDLAMLMQTKGNELLTRFHDQVNLENEMRVAILRHATGLSLGIDDVAMALGIPCRQLRYLLGEYGLTFRQVLDDLRKDVAAELLKKPEWPLTEVAAACGFAEQSNFNRAFRRWFACAPGAYLQTR